ncbi:serpin-ZX-like [Capsicum annuum]|uniref:serpin-ZX-like n=1 Tax=Capsicum annuum TaxID=4072 RepID=UPI001FB05390|nr:serpin-ZX-like [Capsicum annuum]
MSRRKEEKVDSCALVTSRIILKQIQNTKNAKTNILLSPLSFHAVMNMMAAGARADTLDQMLQFLGVRDIGDLNSKFLNMCLLSLRAMLMMEEVVKDVNTWAESASRGLIKDILKPDHIREETKVLLANALYFKGTWKFDEKYTKDRDFYLLNGDKISGSFRGYQFVKIPYDIGKEVDSKEFSMFIFLPNEQNRLPSLLEKVNSDPKFFTKKFRLRYESLDEFYIPKFKFTYTAMKQIVRTVKKMGLTLPFDDECTEITEIVDPDGQSFYINGIIQKAFIEVNEKGTEAAAVTVLSDDDTCCMYESPGPRFVADHPFLFMVREEVSRLVLFTGAVLNPSNDHSDPSSSSEGMITKYKKEIQNTKNANTNILLSPLSFHAVLSMTAAGATGHTLNQMIQFLGVSDINELNSKFANMADVIDSNGNGGPDLSFLNGMWVAHTHQRRDTLTKI